MFAVGVIFAFQVLVPIGLGFLMGYGDPTVIEPSWTVSSYLSLLLVMLLLMGVVFQVPLVMTVLSRLGIVEPKTFRKKRRYFILGGFVGAAIITPPDPTTQLLVALPMMGLFELGIVLSMIAYRKRQTVAAGEGA